MANPTRDFQESPIFRTFVPSIPEPLSVSRLITIRKLFGSREVGKTDFRNAP